MSVRWLLHFRFKRALWSAILLGCALSGVGQQVEYDLDVEVVMDTVLYDGFVGTEDVVPEGFRRYRLYAVIPGGALMLGLAADNYSDPIIPPFGYDAGCGCYNYSSLFAPDGYNSAGSIPPFYLSLAPELAYDSWWTSHFPVQGTSVFEAPGTFAMDFDMCSDEVVQGALVVTSANPIHEQVQNNRALIGQITTCESFNFRVCVVFQTGGDIISQCTEGDVEVPDLCAPIHSTSLEVVDGVGMLNAPELPSSVRVRVLDSDTVGVLAESYDVSDFLLDTPGNFVVEVFDTARTVPWSSNTCRNQMAVSIIPQPVWGCTFIGASNFDAAANVDDGSCLIEGCMDPSALNYVPFANVAAPCIHNPTNCLWNSATGEWDCAEFCTSDINQDGAVSIADLLILLGEFAGGCTN